MCPSENVSRISCLGVIDFSAASLESELNIGIDAQCSDLVKNLGQRSRSMDSLFALSDHDPDQPEMGGLNPSDFDLCLSEQANFQMEWPLESRLATLTAGHREATCRNPGPPPGMTTPSSLTTAAEDAPKSPRQCQCCLDPNTNYLDSMIFFLRQFYKKKPCKSTCDAILPQNYKDHLKQNEPPDKNHLDSESQQQNDVFLSVRG